MNLKKSLIYLKNCSLILVMAGLTTQFAFSGSKKSAGADVNLGALIAMTGPIESMAPPILDSVRLAVEEVNKNGGILGGRKL